MMAAVTKVLVMEPTTNVVSGSAATSRVGSARPLAPVQVLPSGKWIVAVRPGTFHWVACSASAWSSCGPRASAKGPAGRDGGAVSGPTDGPPEGGASNVDDGDCVGGAVGSGVAVGCVTVVVGWSVGAGDAGVLEQAAARAERSSRSVRNRLGIISSALRRDGPLTVH